MSDTELLSTSFFSSDVHPCTLPTEVEHGRDGDAWNFFDTRRDFPDAATMFSVAYERCTMCAHHDASYKWRCRVCQERFNACQVCKEQVPFQCPACKQLFTTPPGFSSIVDAGEDTDADTFLSTQRVRPISELCILFDLNMTLLLQGHENDTPWEWRPHAIDLVKACFEHTHCQVGFFAPWPYPDVCEVVIDLLERTTGSAWQISDTHGKLVGVNTPWETKQVLLFDDAFGECCLGELHPSGSAYTGKSLVAVCSSMSDPSYSTSQTVYITCSVECMLDSRENVLLVEPYKREPLQVDPELDELRGYIITLLQDVVDGKVLSAPQYLREHAFHSSWGNIRGELKALAQQTGYFLTWPASLSKKERARLHWMCDEYDLRHQSFWYGLERRINAWRADQPAPQDSGSPMDVQIRTSAHDRFVPVRVCVSSAALVGPSLHEAGVLGNKETTMVVIV